MSSSRINDLCRQLGLICAFTKRPRDKELNPDIWELYKHLGAISNVYRLDEAEIIKLEFKAIGRISDIFLAQYGERIWRRQHGERAGVLSAGDSRANGLYPKDLYWDDEEDRAL